MADRRLLIAGGVAFLSLGLATTGLLVVALKEPPSAPVASVDVPTMPADVHSAEAHDHVASPPTDDGHHGAHGSDEHVAHAPEAAPPMHASDHEAHAAAGASHAHQDETHDHSAAQPTDGGHHGAHGSGGQVAHTPEAAPHGHHDGASAADAHGSDHAADHAAVAPHTAAAAHSGPARLVVVATGIAWNEDLAASASARLPLEVVFTLPADLPRAAQRLTDWRAAGREVLVRFAWQSVGDASDVVPLEATRGVQAGRMEAQWARLATASGGVVVEPEAARTLEPLALGLADATGKLMLLGAEHAGAPPAAWRIDPALLGEAGFAAVMHDIAHETADEPVRVVLLELYPALLEPVLDWLGELEAAGVELAGLDAVHGEHH